MDSKGGRQKKKFLNEERKRAEEEMKTYKIVVFSLHFLLLVLLQFAESLSLSQLL